MFRLGNHKEWSTPGLHSQPIVIFTAISDLPWGINIDHKLLLYTVDTSILIWPWFSEVQSKSLNSLHSINKWCMTTGLSLNLKKTKIIFGFNQQNYASFQITCGDESIQEEMNVKFLWLETDKWIAKCILSLCCPNWTVCAMWLDAWSITALSELLRWYIMHTFIHQWCME